MLSRYAVNAVELAGLAALALDLRRRWRFIPALAPLRYSFFGLPVAYGPKVWLAVPAAAMLFAYALTEWTLMLPGARLPQAGPVAVEAFIALVIWGVVVMQRGLLDVAEGRRRTLDRSRIAIPLVAILYATLVLVRLP